MRRNTLLLLVGAAAALAVACRDSVVAPVRNSSSLSASASSSFSASQSSHGRTLLGTIELSPNGGTYHVGDFDIVVPAGAVCDQAKTKYGARHWDDDCEPASRSITVKVIAQTRHDGVSVDFQPDLRFRPSAGWVTIRTNAYAPLLTSDAVRALSPSAAFFQNFVILYAPSGGGSRVDEARSTLDPTMVTHVNLTTGIVWRRVKHFSGYLVTAGFNCGPAGDNTTCSVDDGTAIGATPLSDGTSISVFVDIDLGIPSVVVDSLSVVADSLTIMP